MIFLSYFYSDCDYLFVFLSLPYVYVEIKMSDDLSDIDISSLIRVITVY